MLVAADLVVDGLVVTRYSTAPSRRFSLTVGLIAAAASRFLPPRR